MPSVMMNPSDPISQRSTDADLSIVLERRLAILLGVLGTWVWVMLAGRDVSWDVINHHLYLPFSLLTGRFREDFFAAGPQSYQNPLGFLPFYWLVQAGGPNWLVGTALALLHGLVFWPLHRLTVAVWGESPGQRWWRLMALAFAAVTPVFLLLAGTSSVDALSSLLVLSALTLVITTRGSSGPAAARSSTAFIAVSGVLMGLAFAVKPVNAVFVLGLAGVLALRWAAGQAHWRDLAVWAVASLAGMLLFMGPWSWWLWQSFGNPLFPLFNQWFGSPYAPQHAVSAGRFLPTSATDWLLRPWVLAQFRAYGSTEALTPDIRPLIASLLVAPASFVVWHSHKRSARELASRADAQLLFFCAITYVLWMATSGNARYAVPGFLLVGLLLVRTVQVVLPATVARIGLGLALAIQAIHYGADGDHRFSALPWDRTPYMPVVVPQRLVEQPFLHLSIGLQSFASLAPNLHREGALINLIGQMSLPVDGPSGKALAERLHRWEGRTRVLFSPPGLSTSVSELSTRAKTNSDRMVARYGLRIDFDDCLEVQLDLQKSSEVKAPPILSCAALPAAAPPPTEEELLAERVFEQLESACPRIFGPPPMVTDIKGGLPQRVYVNTDTKVEVSASDGVFVSHHRTLNILRLGSAEEVAAGIGDDPCTAWRRLDVQQASR